MNRHTHDKQAGLTLNKSQQPSTAAVVEHRHTLLEGNTLLNLAARCGCLKVIGVRVCVEVVGS